MALKPLPRLILIVAVVAGAGFGLQTLITMKKSAPESVVQEPPASAAVTAPPVANEPPAQTNSVAPASNAGLDKLMNAGAKK